MDKIISSDKFKQLRSNITATKCFKTSKDTASKGNLCKNITGMKDINSDKLLRKTVVRGSPRRCQESRKFDFKQLHCSFRTKSKPGEISQSDDRTAVKGPAVSKNESFQKFRSEDVTKSNQNGTLFLGKQERDSSGFLKPLHPAPKRNLYANFVEEELKTFNQLMQRLTDHSVFHEVEIAYHTEKLFSSCQQAAFKLTRKTNPNVVLAQNASWSNNIQSWLQSSQAIDTSKLPDSRLDKLDKSSKVVSQISDTLLNARETSQKPTAYLLKDWSVAKGSGQTELTVSGMLIDIRSRKVLERNHKSSSILERTGNNFVKTVCCVYQLCGNFVENEQGMPLEIKKYFKDGKFPENWKPLASKWHYLSSGAIPRNNTTSVNNTIKRCLEDPFGNVNDSNKTKKMKPNCNEVRHSNRESESKQLTMTSSLDRSLLNSSVQTRASFRRNRLLK